MNRRRGVPAAWSALALFLFLSSALAADLPEPIPVDDISAATIRSADDWPDIPYCDFISYHDDEITYRWPLPGAGGRTGCAVRFDTLSHAYNIQVPIGAVKLLLHGSRMTGTPSLRLRFHADNGNGLPGAVMDSIDVPHDSLPTEIAWLTVYLGHLNLTVPSQSSFHVSFETIGGEGDTLAILGDNGTGPFAGERHMSVLYSGQWESAEDAFGTDFGLHVGLSRCDLTIPPETRLVPSEYPTIQAAIDAANYQDEVVVEDGTYYLDSTEAMQWGFLPSVVRSANGPEHTIIEFVGPAPEYRPWIEIDTNDTLATLEGFTFRRAELDTTHSCIGVYYGAPTIRNCIFTGPFSSSIYGDFARMTVIDCRFIRTPYGVTGAHSPRLEVQNSTFFEVLTAGGGHGNRVIVRNCIAAFGGSTFWYGVCGDYGSAQIECSNFYGNIVDWPETIAGYEGRFGNMSLPPYFCDTAAGDLHIDSLSPCAQTSPFNLCGERIGYGEPACRVCDDSDNDLFCAELDNCPTTNNPDQIDTDNDGLGDPCDPCPNDPANDADADGLCADLDNCPTASNPLQEDEDADGAGDPCDNCLGLANPDQADLDNDGIGDACDDCTDADHDGYGNPGYALNQCPEDNCPFVANPDQLDIDNDGIGDACDGCIDTDADGYGDPGHPNPYCDLDNCPAIANPDQADSDGDGIGDPCDNCPAVAGTDQTDSDADGRGDLCDNCPTVANPEQADSDNDGLGDLCDSCPNDPVNDFDADGFCADVDNCPTIANPDQADNDGDGIGNACCCTVRGDADLSGYSNVGDITFLVAHLFQGGQLLSCPEQANVDGSPDGSINVGDVTYLVNFLFRGGEAPPPCGSTATEL